MRAPVGVGPATKVVALGPGGRFRSQAGQDLYVYERFFRHRPGPGVYLEFGARDGVAGGRHAHVRVDQAAARRDGCRFEDVQAHRVMWGNYLGR